MIVNFKIKIELKGTGEMKNWKPRIFETPYINLDDYCFIHFGYSTGGIGETLEAVRQLAVLKHIRNLNKLYHPHDTKNTYDFNEKFTYYFQHFNIPLTDKQFFNIARELVHIADHITWRESQYKEMVQNLDLLLFLKNHCKFSEQDLLRGRNGYGRLADYLYALKKEVE